MRETSRQYDYFVNELRNIRCGKLKIPGFFINIGVDGIKRYAIERGLQGWEETVLKVREPFAGGPSGGMSWDRSSLGGEGWEKILNGIEISARYFSENQYEVGKSFSNRKWNVKSQNFVEYVGRHKGSIKTYR